MVFGKFSKKKHDEKVEAQTTREVSAEFTRTLTAIYSAISKLSKNLEELSSKFEEIERYLKGEYIIQLSGIPATLEDLAKIVRVRGAVLIKGNVEVERYGETRLDYNMVLSNVNFTSILHFDLDGTYHYFIREGEKILYVETDTPLDVPIIMMLRKFLRFI